MNPAPPYHKGDVIVHIDGAAKGFHPVLAPSEPVLVGGRWWWTPDGHVPADYYRPATAEDLDDWQARLRARRDDLDEQFARLDVCREVLRARGKFPSGGG
jgi:hypothetical protein